MHHVATTLNIKISNSYVVMNTIIRNIVLLQFLGCHPRDETPDRRIRLF